MIRFHFSYIAQTGSITRLALFTPAPSGPRVLDAHQLRGERLPFTPHLTPTLRLPTSFSPSPLLPAQKRPNTSVLFHTNPWTFCEQWGHQYDAMWSGTPRFDSTDVCLDEPRRSTFDDRCDDSRCYETIIYTAALNSLHPTIHCRV